MADLTIINVDDEDYPHLPDLESVCVPFGIPISRSDFQDILMPHKGLNGAIMDAAFACLIHTYIVEAPRGDSICLAFTCSFLIRMEILRRRNPSSISHATICSFTSSATLPRMAFSSQLEQAQIGNISLAFFPVIVDSDHWALLVFCFHRNTCFYFDERVNRDIALQPARGAFLAITLFFKELWNVKAENWAFVDVVPPLPHEDVWGSHVHCVRSCGVNVLQVVHHLLRKLRIILDPTSLEMAYPPTCLCASYRNVLDEMLRNAAVPAAYVGLNLMSMDILIDV